MQGTCRKHRTQARNLNSPEDPGAPALPAGTHKAPAGTSWLSKVPLSQFPGSWVGSPQAQALLWPHGQTRWQCHSPTGQAVGHTWQPVAGGPAPQVPVHGSLAFVPRAPSSHPRAAPLAAGAGSGQGSSPTGTHSLLACPVTGRALGSSVQPPLVPLPLALQVASCTEAVTDPSLFLAPFSVLPKLVFVSGELFEGPSGGSPSTGPCLFHPALGSLSSALLGCRKCCSSA